MSDTQRCDDCGSTKIVDNCAVCGAPQCCQMCCRIDWLEGTLANTEGKLAAAQATIDSLDCRVREGGDTLHCRVDAPCVSCQLRSATIRMRDLENNWDHYLKRIAELKKMLREVLSSGCEYETKKYKVVQVDQTLWSAINESIK